jgi:cell wall-associated NlpC family hydrolase
MVFIKKWWLIVILVFPLEVFNQTVLSPSEYKRKQILWEGEKYLGKRYRTKVGKSVFDCSGYVKFLMDGINKRVTRSSVSQINDGKKVDDIKDARPGDILVFKGRNARNNRPGHVGLVHHWSNDTLYFIHSSTTKGVVIDNMKDPYYANRFLQVRDIIGN